MKQRQRIRDGRRLRGLVWLSALVAAGVGGLACSSGSQEGDLAGNGGSTIGSGGRNGTGSTSANGGSQTAKGGVAATSTGGAGKASAGGSSTTAGRENLGGGTATSGSACDNGLDDDGDGLVDGFDPECTGPLDRDEASFATGIPGDNRDPKWQDCFFDGNSGAGDDGCRYATECLYGDLPQTDDDCTLTDACVNFCAKLTQSGCDCFGCCTITKPDGTSVDISQTPACSIANLDDTTACPRCTKNTQCGNDCGECELCAGKTVADLPASCKPPVSGTGGAPNGGASGSTGGRAGNGGAGGTGGTSYTCNGGEQVCGPNLAPCENAYYCSFGCCIPTIR